MNSIIEVTHVSKIYPLYDSPKDRLKEAFSFKNKTFHREKKALEDISFCVEKGETVGIIGTNGSGKSTLLKIITGVVRPTMGTISVRGKVSALLELGAGFNPEYTGIENIYLNGTMMKYSDQEITEKLDSIIKFADIGEYINQPVKMYSSGMFARLAFAVAINVDPDILIVDEALSVGDVFFQNKCFRKFGELREKGTTILFVSHDIESVKAMTSRVLWIEQGKQQMFGDKIEVCNSYLKSYLLDNNKMASDTDENDTRGYEVEKFSLEKYPAVRTRKENLLNPDVKVLACFFEAVDGNITYELKADGHYKLVILFETMVDLPECIVGFVLQSKKGVSLINMNTINCGEKRHFLAKGKTINRVEFIMQIPRLHTDEYIVDCAVANGRNVMDNTMMTWCYGAINVYIQNPHGNLAVLDLEATVRVFEQEK